VAILWAIGRIVQRLPAYVTKRDLYGWTDVTGNDPDRGQKRWLAGVFDRAAPTYDRVGDSYHDRFGARLVTAAGVGVGDRVLDVACGRGAVLLPAAEAVGDAGSVVGVDLSPVMVLEARSATDAAGLDARVDVREMDAERLEFAPGSFDIVLCSFGLVFFPRPAQAVEEFVRVVVPGGLVGVSSWGEEDERWAWDDTLLAGLDVRRRAVAFPFEQPAEIADLLIAAGLADVHTHLEHDDIVFASEDAWWEWKWSYSIRGVLEQVDDATRESYRLAAFEAMQPLRQSDGFPMRLTAIFAFGHKRHLE
jgi:ubiquinone/menaquinone biosynthesis C-methylase UbiE